MLFVMDNVWEGARLMLAGQIYVSGFLNGEVLMIWALRFGIGGKGCATLRGHVACECGCGERGMKECDLIGFDWI